MLHQTDIVACCQLRKVEPLVDALAGFDGWISGRRRFHDGFRRDLKLADAEAGRLTLTPLAQWSTDDITGYMKAHDLPRDPLVAKGLGSIGCAPCTTPGAPRPAARTGRWADSAKTGCGHHFAEAKAVRT